MLLRAFAMAAGLAAITSSAVAAENCRLMRAASLPTAKTADGRLLVDLGVNGKPEKLLVASGDSTTYLDPGFVQANGLTWEDHGNSVGYGLSWKTLNGTVRIGELKIGDVAFQDETVHFGNVQDVGGNAVGGMANDVLSSFDVELDPAAGRINFFLHEHCTGKVVYWADEYSRLPLYLSGGHALQAAGIGGDDEGVVAGHRPDIQITLDGQTMWARIDTGLGMTSLRAGVAQRVYGIERTAADAQGQISGADGVKIATFTHRFHSLTIGDYTVNDPEIQIADIDVGARRLGTGSHLTQGVGQADIYLGMSLLKQFHMFIAYSEPALYLTPASASKAVPTN
ncbi:MAG: pepsin/retropepsin-like aspartic protease family protein [Aliidongia sp.]